MLGDESFLLPVLNRHNNVERIGCDVPCRMIWVDSGRTGRPKNPGIRVHLMDRPNAILPWGGAQTDGAVSDFLFEFSGNART